MKHILQFFKDNIANYTVEFSAAFVCWVVSILLTSWFTARRKRKQFYKNLNPVMKTLSLVRQKTKIDGQYIQAIVQSISESFEENFIKQKWYDFIPLFSKNKKSLTSECWVCDAPTTMTENSCSDCKLDCKAWDKKNLPKQMEIEQKIFAIK